MNPQETFLALSSRFPSHYIPDLLIEISNYILHFEYTQTRSDHFYLRCNGRCVFWATYATHTRSILQQRAPLPPDIHNGLRGQPGPQRLLVEPNDLANLDALRGLMELYQQLIGRPAPPPRAPGPAMNAPPRWPGPYFGWRVQ